VPTVSFNVLYVFFVLSLERRRILHVNVTAHPHAAWTAQQMVEAVGFDATLSRVIRDRDGIYGKVFDARVARLGIEQLRIAPRSPRQKDHASHYTSFARFGESSSGRLRSESFRPCCLVGASAAGFA
jgi:putative transposase